MKKQVTYSADAKRCAKKIVIEKFDDIICGNFAIPSQKEMEQLIAEFIDYSFEEYQVRSKVIVKHPQLTEKQVNDKVSMLKKRYNNEYLENRRQAASAAIAEIKHLLGSLKDAIKTWRIKNLE